MLLYWYLIHVFFGVLIMVKRGRPAKVLSNEDLIQLQQFLEKLPFLTEIKFIIIYRKIWWRDIQKV